LTNVNYAAVLKMGTTGTPPGVTTLGSAATSTDALAAIGAFNLLSLPTPLNNTINFGNTTPVINSAKNFQDAAIAISVTAGQNATTSTDLISQLKTLNSQIEQTISSVSGVSMDNEMSNLIILQNAYGSNAQVTNTAQKMLDMLLGIVQ
ncbi:MAG: hypothetical protein ORN98_11315, partial [Alphaproteobacteria bacterium]|nr:hypothetical protein [Alphaproteobacteria bacterium]